MRIYPDRPTRLTLWAIFSVALVSVPCLFLISCGNSPTIDPAETIDKVIAKGQTVSTADFDGTCSNYPFDMNWDCPNSSNDANGPIAVVRNAGDLPKINVYTTVGRKRIRCRKHNGTDNIWSAPYKVLLVIDMTTETVATVPANRARTKLGVGEVVTLTLRAEGASGTWSKTGDGTLSSTTGVSVTFTAPSRAATPTVTVTYGGASYSVQFNVVEPSGEIMEPEPNTLVQHFQGYASVGFIGRAYVTPIDVSFYNIETQEGACGSTRTGYYLALWPDGKDHAAGQWISVGNVVDGKGSREGATDQVWSGAGTPPPAFSVGTFTWKIPVKFRVGAGDGGKQFWEMPENWSSTATGAVTISKGGTSKTREASDPDEIWP